MRKLILVAVLLVALPSCSLMKSIGSASEAVGKLQEKFEIFATAKTAADANKDGKIQGLDEWAAFVEKLLLGLGIAVPGGLAWLLKRNSDSAKLKAQLATDVATLKSAAAKPAA